MKAEEEPRFRNNHQKARCPSTTSSILCITNILLKQTRIPESTAERADSNLEKNQEKLKMKINLTTYKLKKKVTPDFKT